MIEWLDKELFNKQMQSLNKTEEACDCPYCAAGHVPTVQRFTGIEAVATAALKKIRDRKLRR